jgi:hypothetical protein
MRQEDHSTLMKKYYHFMLSRSSFITFLFFPSSLGSMDTSSCGRGTRTTPNPSGVLYDINLALFFIRHDVWPTSPYFTYRPPTPLRVFAFFSWNSEYRPAPCYGLHSGNSERIMEDVMSMSACLPACTESWHGMEWNERNGKHGWMDEG